LREYWFGCKALCNVKNCERIKAGRLQASTRRRHTDECKGKASRLHRADFHVAEKIREQHDGPDYYNHGNNANDNHPGSAHKSPLKSLPCRLAIRVRDDRSVIERENRGHTAKRVFCVGVRSRPHCAAETEGGGWVGLGGQEFPYRNVCRRNIKIQCSPD
jgi:hypothetical protein